MEFIEYNGKKIPIAESFNGNLIPIPNPPNATDEQKLEITQLNKKIKFNRMARLAKNMDSLITKLQNILITSKDIKIKQSAFGLLMMIETGIRVGNEDSAKGYICNLKGNALSGQKIQTYGLTSLLKEHLHFTPDNRLRINFLGKKAVEQNIEIKNPELIKWAKYFYDKSNKKSKKWLSINEKDLRQFVKDNIGKPYKVKDFRTLRANLTAGSKISDLQQKPLPEKKKQMTAEIKEITESTAVVLGNTPGICRTAYINPEIINWHILERYPKFFDKPKPRNKKKKNTNGEKKKSRKKPIK
jgi:DNA topoisomerase IB